MEVVFILSAIAACVFSLSNFFDGSAFTGVVLAIVCALCIWGFYYVDQCAPIDIAYVGSYTGSNYDRVIFPKQMVVKVFEAKRRYSLDSRRYAILQEVTGEQSTTSTDTSLIQERVKIRGEHYESF